LLLLFLILSGYNMRFYCNEISPTWNKKQFIECNIMVQKHLAMVAILGAIAGLGIGMVTTGQVKAMSVQSIDWHCIWQKDSNGYDVCISYNQPQQPTFKQASINCNKNDDGSWTCAPEAFTQSAQPTFKQVDCVSCENGCGCYGSSAINQPAISKVEWGSICGSGGCFNGNHICSDGDSCNSAYTQHPTFQQVDNNNLTPSIW
jgi:hypothetical protein